MHGVHDTGAAAHVEQRLLLAGERRLREVFGGRGRAHGDRCLDAAFAHRRVACDDLLLEAGREGRLEDPVADARAGLGEACDVIHVERREFGVDAVGEPAVREKLAVGVGRRGESPGDGHAQGCEVGDHLAERRVLAAHQGDVVTAEFCKGDGVADQGGPLATRVGG